MRRLKFIAGILVAVVAAFAVAIYVALSQLDLDAYRAEIQRRVQAATGRNLAIEGAMHLDVGLMPSVTLEQVRFANAPWASDAHLVTVRRFELELALWPLITGELRVNRLVLVEPVIRLETGPDGRGNWQLAADAGDGGDGSPPVPAFQRIRIEDGRLAYHDNARGKRLELALRSVTARASDETGTLRLHAQGEYQGELFTLSGDIGPPRALLASTGSFPLDLTFEAGDARLHVAGTVADLPGTARADLEVDGRAANLARLAALAGTELPALGPLSIRTNLTVHGDRHTLEGLTVEIGDSDISGSATLDTAGERPHVSASLKSAVLDLADLRPRQQDAGTGDTHEASAAAPGRLFGERELPLNLLRALDGEADLKIGTMRLGGGISLSAVTADVTLADGRLAVQPLSGRLGNGALDIAGTLDAAAEPPRLDIGLAAEAIDYGRLLADMGVSDEVAGKAGGEAQFRGTGNSPRALAAGLSGRMQVVGEEGRVSNRLLEAAGSDVARVVAPWREADDAMAINCVVARFDVKGGVMHSRALLADTNAATVLGAGTISLRDERFDLRLTPQAKQASLMSFVVPMRVTGPLTDPGLAPDAWGTAKAGAIAAGSLINPLATLAALLADTAATRDNPCVAALERAERLRDTEGADADAFPVDDGNTLGGFLEGLSQSIDKQLGVEDDDQQDDPAVLQDGGGSAGN